MMTHPNPRFKRLRHLISLVMLTLAAACQSSLSAPILIPPTRLVTPVVIPSPTAVLATGQVTPLEASVSPVAPVPTDNDSVQFVFPTQEPEPVSAWRPPLYPTPWVPTPYDHFFFVRPIAADEINWPLANYRYGGVFFANVVHTGIDIPVKTGTKIHAAGPGRVNWTGYGLLSGEYNPEDPYGMAVVIRHDFGYQGQTLYTVYGHMSRIDVARGQHVQTGELLGLSGATGKVTGAHLHFEVRIGRNSFSRSRNPELWLSPPQGWGILAGRLTNRFGELLSRRELLIISAETGQRYKVQSYGEGSVNSDPYYRENVAIGDLPAGRYTIWLLTETTQHAELEISPGMVSYFTFNHATGFSVNPPPAPYTGFTIPVAPESPNP